ncbi:fibronectin type III domain-containing protein [Agathobacter ruminis]|uniref:Fibronectin type-III domain-containing protein n=1 Tax=Agathobacter ruminis TaxID=1712665 RepID=A0A2G3DZ24_9FIRM|nr:fibronectin type III domain-containing protein [Agathobacter ruminis]MDC7301290.1 fibronectin type III domain-containing protein [Agathobacter ruminis]PHU36211.1 hypothetical protein CSX02_13070 [Agathobacter ruminis]
MKKKLVSMMMVCGLALAIFAKVRTEDPQMSEVTAEEEIREPEEVIRKEADLQTIINDEKTISIDVKRYDVEENEASYDEETLAIIEDLKNAVETPEEIEKAMQESDEVEQTLRAQRESEAQMSEAGGVRLIQAEVPEEMMRPLRTEYTTIANKNLIHESQTQKCKRVYGVDVSHWQDRINWTKAKAAGVQFAIIKVGGRSVYDGSLYYDSEYYHNIEGAHEAGVKIGIYFFSQDMNTTEAKASANYVINKIEPYRSFITYPVFYDMEGEANSDYRISKANFTKAERTKVWCTFCDTIKAAGYTPGTYSSYSSYYDYSAKDKNGPFPIDSKDGTRVDTTLFEQKGYYIWLARYFDRTGTSRKYNMWQYSESGTVSGIAGHLTDLDVAYIPVKPGQVTGLKQTASTEDSITFEWKRVDLADGYYYRVTDKAGTVLSAGKTADTSLTLTKLNKSGNALLQAGSTYQIAVRAYYDAAYTLDGTNLYGKYSEVLTATTRPAQVQNLSSALENIKSDRLTLSWSKVTGAKGYQIRLWDASKSAYVTLQETTATTVTLTGLKPQTRYVYRVRAYNYINGKTKTVGLSSEKCTTFTKPDTIKQFRVLSNSATAVKLSWSAQSVDAYQLLVYRGSTLEQKIIIDKTQTQAVVRGLKSGTEYTFKIRGYFVPAGESARWYAVCVAAKMTTKPAQPVKLTETSATTGKITLGWEKITGATQYQIAVYDTKTAKYKTLAYTTKTAYTVTGLKSNKRYRYKVRAYKTYNGTRYYGAYSAEYVAATKAAKLQNLRVTDRTDHSLTLTWSKVSGAQGYQVLVYDKKDVLVFKTFVKTTGYTVENLNPAYEYHFKVRAYKNATDKKVYGACGDLLKSITKPTKVTGLEATVEGQQLTLTWTKTARTSGYRIYQYDPNAKKSTLIATTADLTFTIDRLQSGKEYHYRVAAYRTFAKKNYIGSASSIVSVTVE